MIPDVCITVASYDDLECEDLYFMTTDCPTNTVKALLIIELLKGAGYKPRYHWILPAEGDL